ncbi:hypothetical protein GCM10009557_56590 [Virgisporangium ochraceum]|uniref:Uncharacterized protein n=1 Tax=Virgisporangium ochraceum TaxID=65505 RepID=A0A8J3ZPF1_9ACTN|nr:hypothetical protein [Virgisporangium ochraceum]GIJ67411.1 hypothetical protein Voc01_023280 [Virgisporangium ochraceum]
MDDDRHLEITPVTVTVLPAELPEDEREGAADAPPPPDRTVLRLKIALAAAVAVAVALAGALFYVRHQSEAERAATEAIAAYTRAWNAHDYAAVRKAMAGNGTFAASDALDRGTLFTAYIGPELERVLGKLFEAGVHLETPGTVTIAGDDPTRASIAQQFSYTVYGLSVQEHGISHYTLGPISEDNRKLVVVQHVFWRPRTPGNPSMLWILE